MKKIFGRTAMLWVIVSQVALAEKVHFEYYCDTAIRWTEQTGKEITEENLIESLRLAWETQRQQIRDKVDEMEQKCRDGEISNKEFADYVKAMPVPLPERSGALTIIATAKLQSPEIDRVVMDVYAESMEKETVRFGCIKVILNNNPETGLEMLREFIADEERVSFSYRLLGASVLVDHGFPIDQKLIDKGLEDPDTRRSAEGLQKKSDELQAGTLPPREPVKTVAPPHNPIIQEPAAATRAYEEVHSIQQSKIVEEEQAAPKKQDLQPVEKPSRPWKTILSVLGFATLSFGILFRLWVQRKG